MSNYVSKEFWKGAVERAIRTAAQTAIALIGTDQVGVLALDWSQIGSVVATATIMVLKKYCRMSSRVNISMKLSRVNRVGNITGGYAR